MLKFTNLAQSRGLATLLLALSCGLAAAQTLFNASERVLAGEPFRLVGDSLATGDVVARRVLSDGTTGPDLVCTIQSRTDAVVMATTPATIENGLWEVFVRNGASKSNSLYVNRARAVTLDSDECGAGDAISVYGHNLVSTTGKPGSVAFVAPDGTRVPSVVSYASEHFLTVLTPAGLVPGTNYGVVVTNNEGTGAVSESTSPSPILATTLTGSTLFGMKAPWTRAFNKLPGYSNVRTDTRLAVRAVGDGVADDTAAIQGAIDLVSRGGGGLVVIPAGTYNVDAPALPGYVASLYLRPNVVLRGDSASTVLRFGMRYTPTNAPGNEYWMQMAGPGLSGMSNLTIQNMNGNSKPNLTIRRGGGGAPMDRVAFKYVTANLGNGSALSFDRTTRMAMENCTFNCTSLWNSPFYFPSCRWLSIRNTTVRYRAGRIWMQSSEDTQIADSVFERDMDYSVPGSMESGGLETSFGQRVVIRNNRITGVGPVSKKGGVDGEMIMTQNSNVPDLSFVGTATAGTGTTLTDANVAWPTSPWQSTGQAGSNHMVLAITGGKGFGQWRFVKSVSGQTITVDAPWQVAPDATSSYTIGGCSNYQQFIMNNAITNGGATVVFYNGSIDSLIYQNQGLNAGPISVRGCYRPMLSPVGSNYRNEISWYNQINGNYLRNSNAFVPAAISIQTVVPGAFVPMSTTLGTEVRGNAISVSCGFLSYSVEGAGYDGFWNVCIAYSGRPDPLGNVGTVLSKNGGNMPQLYYTIGATSHLFKN